MVVVIMNLYMFYKKPQEGFDDPPTLYAFTNSKELKDKFVKFRNMNKFIFRKDVGISKKEYVKFSSKWHKYELITGQFYTRAEMHSKKIPVSVLCTCAEEDTVLINSDRLWSECKSCLFDASILNSKYLRALNTLMYFKFYGFYKLRPKYDIDDFYEPYYSAYGPPTDFIMSELQEGYSYDDLKLFLRFFGDTFK